MTLSEVLFLRLHAIFQGLYFICEPKFYARMHKKLSESGNQALGGKPHSSCTSH